MERSGHCKFHDLFHARGRKLLTATVGDGS